MYNGQFMKGFVHVMAFVCMIWMADRFGPIMVPVFFAYFFYLVFDAYKTAHALELGQPVPDPFGFERMFGPTPQPRLVIPGARVQWRARVRRLPSRHVTATASRPGRWF